MVIIAPIRIRINSLSSILTCRSRKGKVPSNSCEVDRPGEENTSTTEIEGMPVKGDEIIFRYRLRQENMKDCGLDHIDVTFEGAAIRKLWQNFHKRNGSDESEISKEEMERFHFALRSHVRKIIKLRLNDRSKFILTQVYTLDLN